MKIVATLCILSISSSAFTLKFVHSRPVHLSQRLECRPSCTSPRIVLETNPLLEIPSAIIPHFLPKNAVADHDVLGIVDVFHVY